MTDDEIETLWLYARRLWPLFEIPENEALRSLQTEVWRDMLGDVPADAVRSALLALSGEQYPPPLGQVRKEVHALLAKAAGEPAIPDVDQAWGEVVAAFGLVGRYATPSWSHPAIASTVRAIGWVEMCDSTDQGVLRGQFARLYATCRERVEREAVPLAPAVQQFITQGLAASARAGELLQRVDDVLDAGNGGR